MDIGCQIYLPQLGRDENYYLTSYSHYLSEADSTARFLNIATFGVTPDDLISWNKGAITRESAAKWIREQMNVALTSHRKFFRERLNPRFTHPRYLGIANHPCDAGSRWRKFTFSVKDGYKYWYQQTVGLVGNGPYVITLDGHARTTVNEFKFDRYLKYTFNQTKEYKMCYKPEERVGGKPQMTL